MLDKGQDQKVEEGGLAIQAGGNVSFGLGYSDVRQVALDVFHANFYQLSGLAKELVNERCEEITNEVIGRLHREFPEGFSGASDPDFQYSLFNVQKEYARKGDKEVSELLVELLVEKTKRESRSLAEVIYSEALVAASKLNGRQIDLLTLIYVARHTMNYGLQDMQSLGIYLDRYIKPLCTDLTVRGDSTFSYMEYAGCGVDKQGLGQISLAEIFLRTYKGLFIKGFDEGALEGIKCASSLRRVLFRPCIRDSSKIQLVSTTSEELDKIIEAAKIEVDDADKIRQLLSVNPLGEIEVQGEVTVLRNWMKDVFDMWSESSAKSFTLSSVGMAIAHSNLRRHVPEFPDISIWIK